MGKFCSNCGAELKEGSDVCLSCGKLTNSYLVVEKKVYVEQNNSGKGLATLSVVFGSLGFYPLIFFGSIVGLVAALVGINDRNNAFKGRSKIGLGLSIGSLVFWVIMLIIAIIASI